MTNRTFMFVGTITAEQPLATASKDLIDREKRENDPTPIPTITKSGREDGVAGQINTQHTVMYFPSSGLRGKIRRCAVKSVRDGVIKATGNAKPFSLDEHYLLTLGGVKGGGSMVRITMDVEEDWLSKNPLLSVFGAGDGGVLGFVRGGLSMGNAFCPPGLSPCVFSGARTDDLYRDKSLGRFLSAEDLDDLVTRSEGNSARSKMDKEIKSLNAQVKSALKSRDLEQVSELKAKIDKLEKDKQAVIDESGSGGVSLGRTLPGYKAIPVGAAMSHNMKVFRAGKHDLGMLLSALDEFSKDPMVGGHISQGCGEISFDYEIYEIKDGQKLLIGNVSGGHFLNMNVEGEELSSALTSFKSALEAGEFNFSIPDIPPRKIKAALDALGAEDDE